MTLEEKLKFFKDKGFTYDSETGEIYNIKKRLMCAEYKGYILLNGSKNNKTIRIRAHQYAWYIYYNEVPTEIDHINSIKNDNRILNLRSVNRCKNCWNRDKAEQKNGYEVRRNKKTTYYRSKITVNNKVIYLGNFLNIDEAHKAYLDAKKIYHKI